MFPSPLAFVPETWRLLGEIELRRSVLIGGHHSLSFTLSLSFCVISLSVSLSFYLFGQVLFIRHSPRPLNSSLLCMPCVVTINIAVVALTLKWACGLMQTNTRSQTNSNRKEMDCCYDLPYLSSIVFGRLIRVSYLWRNVLVERKKSDQLPYCVLWSTERAKIKTLPSGLTTEN